MALVPLSADVPLDDPKFLADYAEARDASPGAKTRAKSGSVAALIGVARKPNRRRAAIEALYWTRVWISYAVVIGPGMVGKDDVLAFRQRKTGEMAYVPWTRALPPQAEDNCLAVATIVAIDRGQMRFLATSRGTRSGSAFGRIIREAARWAGIQKSAHGLPKSRAVAISDTTP